jgi:hypothetical protein
MSFVFTIQLIEGAGLDESAFTDLAQLAVARESLLVPIRLICDIDELCRRIVGPGRAEMLKQISPEAARRRALEHSVLSPSHPNLRTIDVTQKSPAESVEAVLAEVRSIKDK